MSIKHHNVNLRQRSRISHSSLYGRHRHPTRVRHRTRSKIQLELSHLHHLPFHRSRCCLLSALTNDHLINVSLQARSLPNFSNPIRISSRMTLSDTLLPLSSLPFKNLNLCLASQVLRIISALSLLKAALLEMEDLWSTTPLRIPVVIIRGRYLCTTHPFPLKVICRLRFHRFGVIMANESGETRWMVQTLL